MIASGAYVVDVAAVLGHATPTMTLNVYGHLFPDRLDDVRDHLNSAITPRSGQNPAISGSE